MRNSLGILRYKIADIFLEWMIKVSFSVLTNFGNFGNSFFFLNFFYKDPEILEDSIYLFLQMQQEWYYWYLAIDILLMLYQYKHNCRAVTGP